MLASTGDGITLVVEQPLDAQHVFDVALTDILWPVLLFTGFSSGNSVSQKRST